MPPPVTLEYANCLADRVGEHGLDPRRLDADAETLAKHSAALEASRGTGAEVWRTLADDPLRSVHVDAVTTLVDRLRPWTENLVVLGIGGSALGTIALQAALNPHTWNLVGYEQRGGPRLFVLDNVDPCLVADTLAFVETSDPGLRRTVVAVISKSGETAETAAQFMIARERLRERLGAEHHAHVVAITDPALGTMRAICKAEGYATLPIPAGVGGRFSVLSPVGLFSAAMCGIDIEALLDGAAAMDARCRSAAALENPAAVLAWLLVRFTEDGKPNHVLMPYSSALASLADWYRQLWAESLGKKHARDGRVIHAGPTPIRAVGATDQHSQLQLYREGPNDKVIGFVEVGVFARNVLIPGDLDVEPLRYLHGKTLGTLLGAEKRATEYALVESRRPNYTLRLPSLDPHAVGQLIQLWLVTTAYAGRLLDVDAYDQPAVETGKQATFGLMDRPGYEAWSQRVEAALPPSDRVV